MRFLNVVLTIIAIELGWIAVMGMGVPVAAQQGATRVVITGVERDAFVPVAVLGQPDDRPQRTGFLPIDIRSSSPLKIEADRPLRIQEPVTQCTAFTTFYTAQDGFSGSSPDRTYIFSRGVRT